MYSEHIKLCGLFKHLMRFDQTINYLRHITNVINVKLCEDIMKWNIATYKKYYQEWNLYVYYSFISYDITKTTTQIKILNNTKY